MFLRHDTGGHPESAERVRRAYEYLQETQIAGSLVQMKPRPARDEEILLVHSRDYLDRIRSLGARDVIALDPDTLFSAGSLEAALAAAGAVAMAVDSIKEGAIERAFCLVRPPGHHAMPDRAMGFCIFNNIAVGAAHATRDCGFSRAAIIDFDVHHGNGTQHVFYDNADVLYCSTHQWPYYPGTGSSMERGEGPGRGKTVNFPLSAGIGEDTMLEVLRDGVLPAVRDHRPEIIFISAGFDGHRSDPIGGMALEAESYRKMTLAITEVAQDVCGGKIVSALEGGYNVDALARSIHAHLEALAA